MERWLHLGCVLCCIACGARVPADTTPAPVTPPVAQARPHVWTAHGDVRDDPWSWLSDRGTPEVRQHVEAEAAWTNAQLRHLDPLRDALHADAIARQPAELHLEERLAVGHSWRAEVWKGDEHPTISRCAPREGCEVVLSVPDVVGDAPAWLGAWWPSPDQRGLAYTLDTTGDGVHELRFTQHPDVVAGIVEGGHWSADGRGVFYVVGDAAGRPWQVKRHVLGTDSAADTVVFEEDDARFHVGLRQQAGQLWITAESATTSEVHRLDLSQPDGAPQVVWPRRDGEWYRPILHDRTLYIQTASAVHPGALSRAPLADPRASEPVRLPIVEGEDVLERIEVVGEGLAALVRAEGRQQLMHLPFDDLSASARPWKIWPAPHEVEVVEQGPSTEALVVRASSWLRTPVLMRFDAEGLSRVPGPWVVDPSGGLDLTLETWVIAARDGEASLPVTVLHRRDEPFDGTTPVLLTTPGSEGLAYQNLYLSLLSRGVAVAHAHVRGDGQLGLPWRAAGRLAHTERAITDLVDVARALADKGFDHERMVLHGASSGGLLVGAVMNSAPGLFHAVVAEMPDVDVLTRLSDLSLAGTARDREVWGDPTDPAQYAWLRALAPYDTVAMQHHPALMVTAGWYDGVVGVGGPAKWVQRVRALRSNDRQTLLSVDFEVGHAGTGGRLRAMAEQARIAAWVLEQVGLAEGP